MKTNKIHHMAPPVKKHERARGKGETAPQSLQSFAELTGAPAGENTQRKSLSDVAVPERHLHLGAIRYTLSLIDAVVISAIMLLVLLNAYTGAGGHDVLAPVVFGTGAAVGFFFGLKLTNAHQFGPRESWLDHMKKVAVGAFSAMGLWLAVALVLKPVTFLPDALAASGLLAIAALFESVSRSRCVARI